MNAAKPLLDWPVANGCGRVADDAAEVRFAPAGHRIASGTPVQAKMTRGQTHDMPLKSHRHRVPSVRG
jgi:hypothetical protein